MDAQRGGDKRGDNQHLPYRRDKDERRGQLHLPRKQRMLRDGVGGGDADGEQMPAGNRLSRV